jgi:hypothetical protein
MGVVRSVCVVGVWAMVVCPGVVMAQTTPPPGTWAPGLDEEGFPTVGPDGTHGMHYHVVSVCAALPCMLESTESHY